MSVMSVFLASFRMVCVIRSIETDLTSNLTRRWIVSRIRCARTHGVSSLFAGKPVFLFGETCTRGLAGSGTTIPNSGAVAVAEDEHGKPITRILATTEKLPQPLIAFPSREHRKQVHIRCHAPILQLPTQPREGVVYFEQALNSNAEASPSDAIEQGVGIGEVTLEAGTADRDKDAHRPLVKTRLLFDTTQPKWGGLTTLAHGRWLYLYGPAWKSIRNSQISAKEGQPIFLCRVSSRNQAYLEPNYYQYWTNRGFVPYHELAAANDGCTLAPVMFNKRSGSIFYTRAFGNIGDRQPNGTLGGCFVFVGLEASMDIRDAKIRFLVAPRPEGPWTGDGGWLLDLAQIPRRQPHNIENFAVHTWASDFERTGELMVSWDSVESGVQIARLYFHTLETAPRGVKPAKKYFLQSRDNISINSHMPAEVYDEVYTLWLKQLGQQELNITNPARLSLGEQTRRRDAERQRTLRILEGQIPRPGPTLDEYDPFRLWMNGAAEERARRNAASRIQVPAFARRPFVEKRISGSDDTSSTRAFKEAWSVRPLRVFRRHREMEAAKRECGAVQAPQLSCPPGTVEPSAGEVHLCRSRSIDSTILEKQPPIFAGKTVQSMHTAIPAGRQGYEGGAYVTSLVKDTKMSVKVSVEGTSVKREFEVKSWAGRLMVVLLGQ